MTGLAHQRIVTTQRADLAAPLVALLRKHGARPLQVPVTQWLPPPNPARFDKILARANAGSYDWILFSNPHTVHYFFARYRELFGAVGMRALANTRLCAYGPVTGRAMRNMRLKPAAIAADHKTELILQAVRDANERYALMECGDLSPLLTAGLVTPPLPANSDASGPSSRPVKSGVKSPHSIKNQRFLIIRGPSTLATENVPQALRKLGALVTVLQGYATEINTHDPSGDAADMLARGADWIIFASAQAITHFNRRFNLEKLLTRHPATRIALTNKTLRSALQKTGISRDTPIVISRPNDPRDLLQKIRKHRARRK